MDQMVKSVAKARPEGLLLAATYAGGEIHKVVRDYGLQDQGSLQKSFLPAKFVTHDGMIGAAALSRLEYARILNEGGIITPKTVTRLAIPLPWAERKYHIRWPRDFPSAKPRGRFGDKKRREGGAKPNPNALHLIPRKGKAYLSTVSKTGKVKHKYVLKDEVEITPRYYIDEAEVRARPRVAEIMSEAITAETKAGMKVV